MNFIIDENKIEKTFNALFNAKEYSDEYTPIFEKFKEQCQEQGIEFEYYSFEWHIKEYSHPFKLSVQYEPYKEITDKVHNFFNKDRSCFEKWMTFDGEYDTITIEELTNRFDWNSYEKIELICFIENSYKIKLEEDIFEKIKYFRELIYIIYEKVKGKFE